MPNNDFTSPGTSRSALESAYLDHLKEAQVFYKKKFMRLDPSIKK